MPRLLIVTTVESTLRAFLLPYADHYRRLGWQVDSLASGLSNCEECASTFDCVWDIQWSRNPANLTGVMSGLQRVKEIVANGHYDIVHVHTPVAAFIVRTALRKRGSRPLVVYTAHGFHFHSAGSVWKNKLFLHLERLAGKWTDALVTINEEDFAAAKSLRLVPINRLFLMPGIGIDIEHYSMESVSDAQLDRLRQELELNDSGCIFLQVAEFIPRKRHEDILRAFSQLKFPATLLLAGPGPLQPKMRNLAARLGIICKVKFLGLRKDIPSLMRLADVVVLSSQQEGLPRCVMEAMAMGRPVIGSDVRGIRDLLKDDCGVLFPVGDVSALTEAMTRLGKDPELCRHYGSAGRQAIMNYDIKSTIALHDNLYKSILTCAKRTQMKG